jgi:hypothetical protein
MFWIGGCDAHHEAVATVAVSLRDARVRRDGPLAIASLCLRGDLALAAGRGAEALEAFGEALGLSEFATSEVASVTPLAGLARAHAVGRAPSKAASLARRARDRAERTGDLAGLARALLALGSAQGEAHTLSLAAETAERAPHRPLALHARLAALGYGSGVRSELARQADAMGMRKPQFPPEAG